MEKDGRWKKLEDGKRWERQKMEMVENGKGKSWKRKKLEKEKAGKGKINA